jgi:AcrR family transcriptional regulator
VGSALESALDVAGVPDGAHGILAAAACLFARKGYGPTTVRTIASAAEVTVPMVYYYFDGKEQIFVTLFESLGRDFFNRLDAVKAQDGLSFREELIEVGRVFRALLYPCPVALQLMTQFVFGPPESRPPLDDDDGQQKVSAFFQQLFESATASGRFCPLPGFEPVELSMFFINVIHGHTVYVMKQMERQKIDHASLYQKYLTDEALERLVDTFLNGAGRSCSSA